MKNLFLCLLISVSSVVAFANDDKAGEFNSKGLQVLYHNMNHIKLEGDARPNEKIKPLIEDAADFYGNIFGNVMSLGGNDDDSADIKLKEFYPDCKIVDKQMQLGECRLHFDYKSGEKVEVDYLVELQHDIPVRVFQNKAVLNRH